MASPEDTGVYLPIRSGHIYAGVAGHDGARLNLGDNYVINQSGFNIHTDPRATAHVDFTGHYSSAALRPVTSYVARYELQAQMKERLHDTVEQRSRSSKILVVCGLGGAGKSQLALSYVERYRDDYTAVFWVDAGAKVRLEADYKQIRNLLYSSKRTDLELGTCVAEVKQWCHHKQGRWLFVFDSADDIDDPQSSAYIDLRRAVIDVPSADVIITTRSQSAKDMTDLEAVQVAELTPAEARDLFLRRSKLPSPSGEIREEVGAIAEELGFFALAINLAAAHVAETPRLRKNPGAYLNECRQRRKALLDRRPKEHVDQYGASVLTTWETSYAAMSERCPEACSLLMFLAFLNPDGLFLELFQAEDENIIEGHATWLLAETSSASVQEALDRGLEVLESYSLISWRDEQSSYSMHKLVHAWSFERSDITAKAEFCKTALSFLNAFGRIDRERPNKDARIISHIMASFARAREMYAESDIDDFDSMDQLKFLASLLYQMGEGYRGYELDSFIHDHHRRRRCADQDEYYLSVVHLADTTMHRGRYQEAVDLLRPVLAQYRESHGPDHRSAHGLHLAGSLGCALGRLGEGAEAEQLLRWALGECETRRDTLTTMRLLAALLSRMGRKKEAEKLSRKAFYSFRKLLGPTAQHTLLAMLDYASVLEQSGQYEKSNALNRRAFSGFESKFGPQNVHTLTCMAQCGNTFRLLGESERANKLLRQALSGLERTLSMDDSYILDCALSLTHCLRGQGSYSEALALFQRALDGLAATFGPGHPMLLNCSSNIAGLESFLRERAALYEALKQESARFDKCLQAGQHFQKPTLCVRRRALTCPGGYPGAVSRPGLILQEESDDSEDNVYEAVSDSEWDVSEVYSRS